MTVRRGNVGRRSREETTEAIPVKKRARGNGARSRAIRRAGPGSRVRAGGCGLPELDLEGEELVEEVGADEAGD